MSVPPRLQPTLDDAGEGSLLHVGLPIEFSQEDLSKKILRGVPAHEIVSGAGAHWEANSQGQTANSWAFSVPVTKGNTVFISHSWKASRFLKYLSLLAFFNRHSTTLAAIAAALGAMLMDLICGVHPRLQAEWQVILHSETSVIVFSWTPTLAGVTVGMIFFFAGQHLRRPFEGSCLQRRFAFLDKLVIHQEDPVLMRRGIHLLGAFIRTSDIFCVLWSEEYLTRLWCSYELAVFAYLKRASNCPVRIEVWPLPFTAIVLAKLVRQVMILGSGILDEAPGDDAVFVKTLIYLISVLALDIFMVWQISQLSEAMGKLERQITTYDLRATQCFNDSDRKLVEASITAWFDPHTGSRDEAIRQFNCFVQGEVLGAFDASFNSISGRLNASTILWVALPSFFLFVLGVVTNTQLVLADYLDITLLGFVRTATLNIICLSWQVDVVHWIGRRSRSGAYGSLPGGDLELPPANSRSCSWRRCWAFCAKLFVFNLIDLIPLAIDMVSLLVPSWCRVLLSLSLVPLAVWVSM